MFETEDLGAVHEAHAPLWTHSRRPQWGVGLLTAAGDGRRRLQFQDGRIRTFKEGFYHLLEPFDGSETAAAVVQEELERKHRTLQSDAKELEKAKAKPPVMTFEEQLRVFRSFFPQGFEDPAYIDAWRNAEAARKRHVDPVLEDARGVLDADTLAKASVRGEAAPAFEALLGLLKRTSLASPSKVVQPLSALDEAARTDIVSALHGVLSAAEEDLEERMRAWLLALDADGRVAVTWSMATLPLALADPQNHGCIKPRALRKQARVLGTDALVRRLPSPLGYAAARRVNGELAAALTQAGLQPGDSFDLRAFAWETLRPRGLARLAELNARGRLR